MSWPYWGIVIGLAALVVMLIACIRMLASNGNEDQQKSGHSAGESGDMNPEPSTISRRAA
ncbi:MAG: hypothetical protein AAB308_11865 [Nitrospirota bacterium]